MQIKIQEKNFLNRKVFKDRTLRIHVFKDEKRRAKRKNSHLREKIIIASKRNSFSVLTAGEKKFKCKRKRIKWRKFFHIYNKFGRGKHHAPSSCGSVILNLHLELCELKQLFQFLPSCLIPAGRKGGRGDA